MINKELYFKQVEELNEVKNIDRKDFEILYKVLSGEYDNNLDVDPGYIADKIVNKMSNDFYTQTMISWEFLQTPIGRALIKAKFQMSNDIYFMNDLADFVGCSRQFISKEIKKGNIACEKRGGIVFFREKAVNDYLKNKKGINLAEKNKIVYESAKETIYNGKFERETEYMGE